MIKVTAHTGCEGTEANSLEAIARGAASGANAVEFDVRFLNGAPVLAHDKSEGELLSFAEALDEVKKYDGLELNIDLKEYSNLPEVQRIVEEKGMLDRVYFTGVFFRHVRLVRAFAPKIPYFVNNYPVISSHFKCLSRILAKRLKRRGALGININKKLFSPYVMDAIKEQGLLNSIWTVSDEAEMPAFVDMQPDNITSREPTKLLAVINGKR